MPSRTLWILTNVRSGAQAKRSSRSTRNPQIVPSVCLGISRVNTYNHGPPHLRLLIRSREDGEPSWKASQTLTPSEGRATFPVFPGRRLIPAGFAWVCLVFHPQKMVAFLWCSFRTAPQKESHPHCSFGYSIWKLEASTVTAPATDGKAVPGPPVLGSNKSCRHSTKAKCFCTSPSREAKCFLGQ